MTEILKEQEMSAADWERVGKALEDGALVILPSDTVYGLACLATLPKAVERIFEVKARQHEKPLALVFASVDRIHSFIPGLPAPISRAIDLLMPGPITAIVPGETAASGAGAVAARGRATAGQAAAGIGVRIIPPPEGELYGRLPGPLAVTSVNVSGQPDACAVSEIPAEIAQACDFIIDSGPSEGCVPSTVVDLRPLASGGRPVILREGPVSLAQIMAEIK